MAKRKLAEFGYLSDAQWLQRRLVDVAGYIEELLENEVERVDHKGLFIRRGTPTNRRYDLVEKAKELLEEASSL